MIRAGDIAIKTCHELVMCCLNLALIVKMERLISIGGKEFHRRGILLK